MQAVFKVTLPATSGQGRDESFRPRREHKKSRAGCLACKKRRIKCEESRPSCARCLKLGADCTYTSPQSVTQKTFVQREGETAVPRDGSHGDSSLQSSPTSEMYSMSVDLLNTDLDRLLGHGNTASAVSSATGNVRILQHFQANTFLTLGGPRYTQVFLSSVKNKAGELPYLMHMTLAVSCAHLKRLTLEILDIRLHQQYAIAEASHWQRGLQLYREALSAKSYDFDGTITATFLSVIFTYALDDDIPHDSYTADDPEKLMHALNPLAATAGFGVLRDVVGEQLLESSWSAVLLDSDDINETFTTVIPGIEGLPAAFVGLCDLDEGSTAVDNEYHVIVRLLAPLLRLQPCRDNFTKLISYSGRTWFYFRPLLFRKDPRALLLISYWFALMQQIDQWWISTRAKAECVAIVRYLEQLGDAQIIALLPFPASCGQADIGYIW